MFTRREDPNFDEDPAFAARSALRSITFFKGPASDDTRDAADQQNGFVLLYNANQMTKNFHFVSESSAPNTSPADILPSRSDISPFSPS